MTPVVSLKEYEQPKSRILIDVIGYVSDLDGRKLVILNDEYNFHNYIPVEYQHLIVETRLLYKYAHRLGGPAMYHVSNVHDSISSPWYYINGTKLTIKDFQIQVDRFLNAKEVQNIVDEVIGK